MRDVKFIEQEKVLLKVLPMKGLIQFGKKSKLRLRYIGPFEILKKVGLLAYILALTPSMSEVHLVFHESMLNSIIGMVIISFFGTQNFLIRSCVMERNHFLY